MLIKLQLSFAIFLLIILILEEYDEKAWTKKTKGGEIRFDENGIVMKIGKTIYTAVGYFSNIRTWIDDGFTGTNFNRQYFRAKSLSWTY